LTAMWDLDRPDLPIIRTVLKDLLALMGLAVALGVSFGLTAAGGALGPALAIPLALVANWLVFLWVLAKLPRQPVHLRTAARGAVAAAIGFELLKQAANLYLGLLGRSPTFTVFGSVIGFLVFVYLVARLLLLVTAWTATAVVPMETEGSPVVPSSTTPYRSRTKAGEGPSVYEQDLPEVIRIEIEFHPGQVAVAHVSGDVDMATASQFREGVDQRLATGERFVLDLDGVSFMGSLGFSVLVEAHRESERRKIPWAIVAGRSPIKRPLQITGLEQILPIYPTVPDAVDALSRL
jgi:anti-anti-sigma factor